MDDEKLRKVKESLDSLCVQGLMVKLEDGSYIPTDAGLFYNNLHVSIARHGL